MILRLVSAAWKLILPMIWNKALRACRCVGSVILSERNL